MTEPILTRKLNVSALDPYLISGNINPVIDIRCSAVAGRGKLANLYRPPAAGKPNHQSGDRPPDDNIGNGPRRQTVLHACSP